MLKTLGNKKIKARVEAFVNLVSENKQNPWYVCSHDNPDPDSIASCLGVSHILNFLGVEDTTVTYCGEISHPQNRAMINVLQLRIKKWGDLQPAENAVFVFVDCSFGQKNISIKEMPKVVIDHHKILTNNKEVLFLHDEVGACSTLVFDLALSITTAGETEDETIQCFDPDEEGVKELATALAIGIKTDTLDFLNETTTSDDFQAFRELGRHLSDEKFGRIVNYEFPPYVLDYEQTAWENKRSEFQPHFITGLGYVDESKSDCIPTIADKFMRLQGVQTVVVYGVVENCIRASVRTSSAALDCQTLCDELFGKGNGGAKHGIGGARVSFNVFCPTEMGSEHRGLLWSLIKAQIEGRFERATSK
ncbi:MAG: DHH family phosphoesterase [Promethearchaeota archaeon]|jgi:nanoRNase/pAp phosphatase (c-di-AMP/oligoRNAs hydrolase)